MAKTKPAKRRPAAPRCVFEINTLEFPIALGVTPRRQYDRFTVVYGMQHEGGLSYSEACNKLGQAIMHALTCSGALD